MFLSIDNPVYNTIIVFSVIMILLYVTKPEVIYDHDNHEFRQFGTTDGKTLLPIYVIGILLAIILYVFFHHISDSSKKNQKTDKRSRYYESSSSEPRMKRSKQTAGSLQPSAGIQTFTEQPTHDPYYYYMQQQQIQQLQNQMQQLMQQQILQQQLNNQINQQQLIQNNSNVSTNRTNAILPNNLSI